MRPYSVVVRMVVTTAVMAAMMVDGHGWVVQVPANRKLGCARSVVVSIDDVSECLLVAVPGGGSRGTMVGLGSKVKAPH